MTKGQIAGSIVGGLLFIGGMIALWYHFVYKPENAGSGTGNNEGDTCTTSGGKAGVLDSNGSCIENTPTPRPSNLSPVTLPFGNNVYLNLSAPQGSMGQNDRIGTPVYTYPYSGTNDYLIGLISRTAYAGKIIGTFIANAGTDFSKIKIKNINIWHNTSPVYPYAPLPDGEYFVKNDAIQKTPY